MYQRGQDVRDRDLAGNKSSTAQSGHMFGEPLCGHLEVVPKARIGPTLTSRHFLAQLQ